MRSSKTSQVMALLWAAITLISGAGITATARAAADDVPELLRDQGTDDLIATVTEIDQKTREVTLRGPSGSTLTFIAGPDIKRLNEVHVGDKVHVEYTVSIAAELREPTAEEKAEPLSSLNATNRATKGAPYGTAVHQIKAVVTVEGFSRITNTVTVKGPRGRYVTVRVADPSRLESLHLGDTILLTYTESKAVKLEKVFSAKRN